MSALFNSLAGLMKGVSPEFGAMFQLAGDATAKDMAGGKPSPMPSLPSEKPPAGIKKLPAPKRRLTLKTPAEKAATPAEIGAPTDINQSGLTSLASLMGGVPSSGVGAVGQAPYSTPGFTDLISMMGGGFDLSGLFGGKTAPVNPFISAQNPLGLTPGSGL